MGRVERMGMWVLGIALFAGLFYVIYISFSASAPAESPIAAESADLGPAEEGPSASAEIPPSR